MKLRFDSSSFARLTLAATVATAMLPITPASLRAQEAEEATDPIAIAAEAARQFEQGDTAAAISTLESLRGRGDIPDRGLGLLGVLYLETGRAAEALEILEPLAETQPDNAGLLYNAGRAALNLRDFPRAEAFLQRAVELSPQSPAARELGMLYGGAGRYEQAFLLLRPWVRNAPNDEDARLIAALSALQIERPNDAETLLSDLPQQRPQVRLLWGKLLLLKGDPFGAIGTLQPLLEDSPDNMALDVRRTLADAQASVGQAAEAVTLLDGWVGSNPAVALQLGQARYQSGDLDGALATLEPFAKPVLAAGGQAPDPRIAASIVLEYGRLLVTGGRHEDALDYLELSTRMTPENKQSWHQFGQALAAVGRRDEARAALDRFQKIVSSEVPSSLRSVQLEKDLEDPTGRELREAMRLAAEEEYDRALGVARREAALAPEDIRPRLVEGRVLLMAERKDEAAQLADQLTQAAPGHPDAHYLRALIRMASDDLVGAEADFRTALESSPDHTAALNDLAVLLMETGKEDEARELLQRALEIRPDDDLAAANLERLDQG